MKRRRPEHHVSPGFDFGVLQDLLLSGGISYVEFAPGLYEFPTALRVPSGCTIAGRGTSSRVFLAAGAGTDVITNADWAGGNSDIRIMDLYLNGRGNTQSAMVGDGPGQSGVSLVNVDKATVRDVTVEDVFLHGVDLNRQDANGGPNDEPGCTDIIIEGVRVSTFGDDGITTHWSSGVQITNCAVRNPARYYTSGGNGVEVDDGSANVVVSNCVARNCTNGFKVQGHGDVGQGPAGSPRPALDVTMSGCVAMHDGSDPLVDAAFAAIHGGDAPGAGVHGRNVVFSDCQSVGHRFGFRVGGYKGARVANPLIRGATDAGVFAHSTFTPAENVKVMHPLMSGVGVAVDDPNSEVDVTW